jgi:hypothetical protein
VAEEAGVMRNFDAAEDELAAAPKSMCV